MSLKLQKFAPIDREYPIYEIIDDHGDVLLDVSRSNEGGLELRLAKNASERALPLEEVLSLIQEARNLLGTD